MEVPSIGSVYKHYKGSLYKVISVAHHSETEEILVIYVSQDTLLHWARSLTAWNEWLTADGNKVKRFTLFKS